MGNSPAHVIKSIATSKRMIQAGYSKQKVMTYLGEQNNTEEVSNNLATLAMELHTKTEIKEEKKTLFGGVALSLIGTGITLGTYQHAQGGGTYVVTYGVIIYGIFIIGKSLLDLYDIKEKEERWNKIK